MKIKNIEVEEYIEDLDGSVVGVKLVKKWGDGYGLFKREDGKRFMIRYYGKDEEFIYRVV